MRRDFLVSGKQGGQTVGCVGKASPVGRMYLPAYRAGTEKVAEFGRRCPAERVLPAIYGCSGLVDIQTMDEVLGGNKEPPTALDRKLADLGL